MEKNGELTPKKEQQLKLLKKLLEDAYEMEYDQLRDTVYEFGSLISETDYMERELFVFWATLLNQYAS